MTTTDVLLAQFCPEPRYVLSPDLTAEDLGLEVREPLPDDCLCGHEAHPSTSRYPQILSPCRHAACGCRTYRRRSDA